MGDCVGGTPAHSPCTLCPASLVEGSPQWALTPPSHLPAGHPVAQAGQGTGQCPQERRNRQHRKREADTQQGWAEMQVEGTPISPRPPVAFPGQQALGLDSLMGTGCEGLVTGSVRIPHTVVLSSWVSGAPVACPLSTQGS